MTHIRLAAAITAALLAATAAPADQTLTQLEKSVARTLQQYGIDVDVRTLSPAELAIVNHIEGSQSSPADKMARINSAIGNGGRLRDLFFN
jgi:hypothetical protein